jgi:phosphatidylglycerophosphate synthase
LINSLAISLWVIGTLPPLLVGLWLVRDIILMIATHQYVAQNTTPGMAVMDPVTVPIQVIPTTISKINTALQFITLVVAITTIIPATDTTLTSMATIATTIETPSELLGTIDKNYYNMNDWFLVERIYMKDTILPILCWITGGTTIGSSLSYYGHSAFISSTNIPTKNNSSNNDTKLTDLNKDDK